MEKIAIFVDVQNIYYTVKEGLKGQFYYNAFCPPSYGDKKIAFYL
jgi:hypothetical protein